MRSRTLIQAAVLVINCCTAQPADDLADSGTSQIAPGSPDADHTRSPRVRPPDPTREELEWHQVGATASHLRWSRSARLDSYAQLWEAHPTFDTPLGPDELRVDFAPIVVDDAIIVAGYNGVASLAQSDGSTRWLVTRGTHGDIAVAGGRVILWESFRGPVALNVSDGSVAWARTDVGQELGGGAVVVVGETAFISARPSGAAGGTLFAFDVTTGATKWTVAFDASPSNPTIADGRVIVVDASGRVRALRQDDGSPIWETDPDLEIPSAPVPMATLVADGRVVIWASEASPMVALEATTGRELWRAPGPRRMPVSAYGLVFAAEGNGLVARDLASGREWWRHETEVLWPLLLLDGLVLANTAEGETNRVRFFDAETGTPSEEAIMDGLFYDAVASCGRLVGGVRSLRGLSVRMFGSSSNECRASEVY